MATIPLTHRRTLTLNILPSGANPVGVPVWTVAPTGGLSLFPSVTGFNCDVLNIAPVALQTVSVAVVPAVGVAPLVATQDIQTMPVVTSVTVTAGPEF